MARKRPGRNRQDIGNTLVRGQVVSRGRLGHQVCVFVEVIDGNERGSGNVHDRAGSIEPEKANSTMGEPEIVRRSGVRMVQSRHR